MMQFVLTGFTPDIGFRVFAFDRIAADRTRTVFTVRADLALIRIHGIMIQELPLLCRAVLENREADSVEHEVTFSEDEMRVVAGNRAAEREAVQRKKSLRKIAPRRAPSQETVMGMSHSAVANAG